VAPGPEAAPLFIYDKYRENIWVQIPRGICPGAASTRAVQGNFSTSLIA
jgi:hypothetical protein